MGQPPTPAGDFAPWLRSTQEALSINGEADVPCGPCDGCCRSSYFIHIRPEEAETLARIPKELQFSAPGLPEGHVVMGYNEKGHCPMLREAGCSIYAHRPKTCRAYDCRIFAATGVATGGDEKALVNAQVGRWEFEYAESGAQGESRALHLALRAVAKLLGERRPQLPRGVIPQDPTQLALLAIRSYETLVPLMEKGDLSDGELEGVLVRLRERS